MTGILGINPVAGQENTRDGAFVLSHAPGSLSFDQAVVKEVGDSATYYMAGTVMGKQAIGSTATFAILSGNANTTCGTITLGAGVEQGVYTLLFITGGSATAEFEVIAPNGGVLKSGAIGTAYSNGGLGFTLTDGGTHPAVGDEFTITVGAASFANAAGATGDPTCGTITLDSTAVGGVYTFTYTDATHWTGVDPLGRVLPAGVDGTAYAGGGLHFTITAGGTASVAGDQFTITTTEGDGKWRPVAASAYDGTQNAAGILWATTYVGASTDVKAAMLVRNAEVSDVDLAWPSTTTDDQWLNWISQLEALGIKKRTGVK